MTKRPRIPMLTLALTVMGAAIATGAAAQELKVGVFDAQKVSEVSQAGKKIQSDLTAFTDGKEAEIARREQRVKELQQQLRQQALSISPDRRAEMEKDIQRELLDLQSFQESAQRELQLEYAAAQRGFEEKLLAAIETFAKDESFALILERSQISWAASGIDVTSAIVERVDRLFRNRRELNSVGDAPNYRLADLAARVGGRVCGREDRVIRGIATLDEAGPDDLSFLAHPRYRQAAIETAAGALLVPRGIEWSGCDLLEVAEPYVALVALLELYHPAFRPRPGVSEQAHVDPAARIGAEVHVAPFAVVERDVVLGRRVIVGAGSVVGRGSRVGADTEIAPRVVLYPDTRVGCRCRLHSGVVLGSDGFGFATEAGVHRKLPQVGRVELGDDVEIGANTTIDRAMLGATRVADGSKLDNLVMIAHGVQVGPAALLAAQAGVAGSTRIGRRATLAGQSGIAGHLRIGDDVRVSAKAAVLQDQPDGAFVSGTPAFDHRRWKRSQALYRKLPELRRALRDLEDRIAALEQPREGKEQDR